MKPSPRTEMPLEMARQLLSLDAEAGVLTWLIRRRGAPPGVRAGRVGSRGYRIIRHGKVEYLEHRLIWFMHTGTWSDALDHINGDKTDNRIANLRETDATMNGENRRSAQRDNASGFLGVQKHGKAYRATIQSKGKSYYLGKFQTPNEAYAAYVEAKRRLHAGCTI